MKRNRGYRVVPFSRSRRMMAAAMAVSGERHIMHGITEADITEPRRLIREHHKRTGESHSLTAYVVARLARAVAEHPRLNSMRKRGKPILLDDVTIVTLVERNPEGERVVEYLSIRAADKKSYRQIHDEIRAAQRKSGEPPGAISGLTWVRYIPSFLLRTFIHAMTRNVRWAKRYDVVGVSNIGMFGDGPGWGVSPSATVAVTVGGIASRPVIVEGGLEAREHLCLTISFDHDIVDGAPAARFTSRFLELPANGDTLHDAVARGEDNEDEGA